MTDVLVIATIMFWLVIPLFWIPVHFFSVSHKRIGLKAYLLPAFIWPPLCLLIYSHKELFVQFKIDIPFVLSSAGWILIIMGTVLHLWTARLLGFWGIIGVPEVSGGTQTHLVTRGPFSIVRHPTYLAHTILFFGVFLVTEALSVGIVTLVDFLIVNTLIIPLEEKEMVKRFGEQFRLYKKNVPYRFFPRIF